MQLNDGTAPELTTKELRLANIANSRSQLKQRKTNIKIFRKAINKCENQQYPGLDALGATIIPYYVRGVAESSTGYLIQIPKPSSKVKSLGACLKFYDGFTGEPKTTLYVSEQTFSTNICTYNPGLQGDVIIDCTGPVTSGLIAFYLPKNSFAGSPEPNDAIVVDSIANLSSIGDEYQFEVIPTRLAPGGDCKRIH